MSIFQVGLAVDDIKGIQNAAELKRLELQVIFNIHFEHRSSVLSRKIYSYAYRFLHFS